MKNLVIFLVSGLVLGISVESLRAGPSDLHIYPTIAQAVGISDEVQGADSRLDALAKKYQEALQEYVDQYMFGESLMKTAFEGEVASVLDWLDGLPVHRSWHQAFELKHARIPFQTKLVRYVFVRTFLEPAAKHGNAKKCDIEFTFGVSFPNWNLAVPIDSQITCKKER